MRRFSGAFSGDRERRRGPYIARDGEDEAHPVALELANAELDRRARSDALTGLLNRRGMDEQFQLAMAGARRRRSALSVVLVDVDHFKRVNDRFGHEAGDVALKAIAQVLRGRLRETDIVARQGGEEFVAILPDTDAAQARLLADMLVARVAAESLAEIGQATISCGVAQVRIGTDSIASALSRADVALYRANNEGRNRARFAETTFELDPDAALPQR